MWTVPATHSEICLVKVTSEMSDRDGFDQSDAVFAILPYAEVTSPNGGEEYEISELATITWGFTGTAVSSVVYYSINSGIDWTEIGTTQDDDFNIDWRVHYELSDECLVKVVVTDEHDDTYEDISNAAFSIIQPTKYKSITMGWSLISIPLVADDMSVDAVIRDDLDDIRVAVYGFSPELGHTIPEELEVGQGYFLGTPVSGVIDVTGMPLIEGSYTFDLAIGWNMLGSPYRYITDLEEAEVTIELDGEDVTMSWGDAVEAEYVTPVIYNFFHNEGDPELGGLYWEKTRFHPWYGYWYLVLANDVSLTLNRTEPYPGPERDDVDDYSVNDWHLQVLASVEGALDDLRLGVFEGASDGFANRFDYPEPPVAPIENPIRAYFERGDWNRHIGTMYNRDIREPMERGDSDEWTFQVQPSNDAEVTLSWPNFTRTIPRGDCWYEFYLVDEVNDRTINMRAEESYTYQSEGTHEFTVRVVSSLSAPDAEQNSPTNFGIVDVYPNPFNSTTSISYNINELMQLTLSLYDVNGRMVNVLHDGIVSAGSYQVTYNADNIESGVYFLELTGNSQQELRKIVLMK